MSKSCQKHLDWLDYFLETSAIGDNIMRRIMIENVVFDTTKIQPIRLSRRQIVEIKRGWADTQGQGNTRAHAMGADCVIIKNCNESDAMILSEVFYSNFRMRSCCWYDNGTLSLNCNEAGLDAETLVSETEGFIKGYFTAKSKR